MNKSLFNSFMFAIAIWVVSVLLAWGGYALGWIGLWVAIPLGLVVFPILIFVVIFIIAFAGADWSGLNRW